MSKNKETFHYTQCGLDYIHLSNGFDYKERDGEIYYNIQAVDDLHDCIAHAIVMSTSPLRGMELRFLRSLLGLSQESLARHVGRKRDAIAQSELKPNIEINGAIDRLVRFFYIAKKEAPDEMRVLSDLMDDIAEKAYLEEVDLEYSDGWSIHDKKCV